MFQTTNQLIYIIRYYHSMVFSSDHSLVQLMLKENHKVAVSGSLTHTLEKRTEAQIAV